MKRHTGQTGAALIMVIGITATLAVLTAALVMLLANQQRASANSRQAKTSLYYAEAALDSGINSIKVTTQYGANFPTTSPGVDMTSMNLQYATACPSPAPMPVYNVYDNATPVDPNTHWDANLDHKLWVEATVTYNGHTSRLRQMMDSSTSTSILPEAALYADTSISATGTSDVYAVKPNGTFYTAPPYPTAIMAGGNLTGTTSFNMAPPTGTEQSLNINVNGTVTLPAFNTSHPLQGPANPRSVGLLSDYFDQARQYALTVEAQTGMSSAAPLHNDTAAPTAPTKPTTTIASTQFTPSLLQAYAGANGITWDSGTNTYTFANPIAVSGNLLLSTGGTSPFPAGTTFNFSTLYVTSGTFTVTGNLTVKSTTLYVGGALTIQSATTATTDDLGTMYVTGATAISGTVALTTNGTNTSYFGGTFNHSPSTAVTDNLGPLFFVGNATFSSASGNLSIAGGDNVHASGTLTITGPTSASRTVSCVLGSVYSVGSISITGNAVTDTTDLYTGGGFNVTGNTASITDQFGPIYVAGTVDWNNGSMSARLGIQTTSPTTTAYAGPATPGPMFAQIFTVDGDTNGYYDGVSGPYDLLLGDVWVDGNAGTGNVAVNFSAPSRANSPTASTIMCPLLATTEKTCANGYVDMGTLNDPMVYYMQCDNDGLYSNTCVWASTGTFTGLAVIMEAALQITGGNDGVHPNFLGSVLTGTPISPDVTMSSNSTVCYNQAAIDNLPPNLQSILRTTTTTTVPGTWQQLTAN